ncbi:ankyrin repeat domain-containing protein [Thiosocius teredinicola]|uniref:ankyrin repeat domain-containing protein n=1 Tax=Thiosocius teredinicola TaxID=1973002 RepID=UPI000991474E
MSTIDSFAEVLESLTHEEIQEVYDSSLSVREQDALGDYLLNAACDLIQIENVRYFVEKGASIESPNSVGDTPLLCVIDHCAKNPTFALEIVEYLLDKGAEIEKRGYMEKTPFLKACSRGDLSIIKLLVARGCNVRATIQEPGISFDGLDLAHIHRAGTDVLSYLGKVVA